MDESQGGGVAMKGFTHTLEAILSSILLISSITVISSNIQTAEEVENFEASFDPAITDELYDRTPEGISSEIERFIPAGYRTQTFIRDSSTETVSLGPDSSVYIDKAGAMMYLHVFSTGSDFTVSFRGEEVTSSPGYRGFGSTETSGYLNLSGDGSATVEVVNRSITGEPYTGSEVSFYSFPMYDESPSEARVAVWQ